MSPLPLQECCRLLEAAMDKPLALFGSKPVIGRVDGTKLRARKRIQYRNSFQIRLSADMVEQAGQTRIRCRFSMHPFVTAFMAVWLGTVGLSSGGMLVMALAGLAMAPSQAAAGTWLGILPSMGMLLFGIGLLQVGRYLSRNERQFLTAFVRDTLGAHPL